MVRSIVVRIACLALAVFVSGCGPLRDLLKPGVPSEWEALLADIRRFEQRIGYSETRNFQGFEKEQDSYPICGVTSRLSLPYSYQDPAIQWREVATEKECRAGADGSDIFFARVEAWGEIGTPVTPAMLGVKLDRFLYLVIHEDCHDQFDLPYGIEEALCNLITYKGMAEYSRERFGADSREFRSIRRYADSQSALTNGTRATYEQLSALYARYGRGELTEEALLKERTAFFRKAEKVLAWQRGQLNNVSLANDMTYSRHYPLLERVHESLGSDLARTVAFFRQVDRAKPTAAAVRKRYRLLTETSVEFIRAHEEALVETIERELPRFRSR